VDLKELKRSIAQKEGLKIDFKRDLHPSSIQDLSKDIAAFANTEGGHILIGVEDNGNVIGVDWNAEKSRLVYGEGMNCLPQISVSIETVPYPRVGTVAVVSVPKSTFIHRDSKQRFPQRLGDSTVFMDTAMLLSLAMSKGLVTTGSQLVYPAAYVRKKPKKVAFLGTYLTSPKQLLRAEALTDLANISYVFAIEDLPEMTKKIRNLLGDVDSAVRLAALNVVSNVNFRIDAKKKKEYQSRMGSKLVEVVYKDKDVNVRQRALSVLADIASPKVIDVIIQLSTTEPAETYPKLNFQNIMMRITEAGVGLAMGKRLYAELDNAKTPEAEARLKEILGFLRNTQWAR